MRIVGTLWGIGIICFLMHWIVWPLWILLTWPAILATVLAAIIFVSGYVFYGTLAIVRGMIYRF